MCASFGISVSTVRFREKQIENAERDRLLADDPDHEEGEMYSGSDVDYDDRRGSTGGYRVEEVRERSSSTPGSSFENRGGQGPGELNYVVITHFIALSLF